ncbi:MAG: glycosyltransferase [Planctomycetota bacterium]
MAEPRVSVIMPAFNAASYIRHAVKSMLNQDEPSWELLILDDGSTDETLGAAKAASDGDPRVIVWSQENRGVVFTRNALLQRCRADYVAMLDADDIAHPERLAFQSAFLDARPGVVVCGTDVLQIDEEHRPIGVGRSPHQLDSHAGRVERLLEGDSSAIRQPSAMMRRQAIERAGRYVDRGVSLCEDLELMLKLSEVGEVCLCPRPLTLYRRRSDSLNLSAGDKGRDVYRDILRDAYARRGLDRHPPERRTTAEFARSERLFDWSRVALREGFLVTSRRYIRRALLDSPVSWKLWVQAAKAHLPRKVIAKKLRWERSFGIREHYRQAMQAAGLDTGGLFL